MTERLTSKSLEHNPRPRNAYNFYFRFCTIVDLLPESERSSFALGSISKTNELLYKSFVERILSIDPNDLRGNEIRETRNKYMGNGSFVEMSKELGRKWHAADEITQTVFKEIATKDQERYNKALFASYQSFARNHPANLDINHTKNSKHSSRVFKNMSAGVELFQGANNKKHRHDSGRLEDIKYGKSHSKTGKSYLITEVDTPEEDIRNMAASVWGVSAQASSLCQKGESNDSICQHSLTTQAGDPKSRVDSPHKRNRSEFELNDFLSGVDWNSS